MQKIIVLLFVSIISLTSFQTAKSQNLDSIINFVLEQGSGLGKVLVNFTMISEEDEIMYGDQFAVEFEKNVILTNTGVSKVEKLGNKLTANVDRKGIPYIFKVIETDEVNAFALPGGHVYVTTALINMSESDDELAFVIGHEIGHVDRKHSLLMIQTLALGSFFGGDQGEMIASIAYQLLSTPFTKYQEFDADEAGAYFTYYANYDPNGGITFFEKLERLMDEEYQKQNSGNIDYVMRSHPWSSDRAQRLKNYINTNLK